MTCSGSETAARKRLRYRAGSWSKPGEISAFSVTQLNDVHERLRILLGILGEEYALQVQWSIDSDYRHELERYHRETLDYDVKTRFMVNLVC